MKAYSRSWRNSQRGPIGVNFRFVYMGICNLTGPYTRQTGPPDTYTLHQLDEGYPSPRVSLRGLFSTINPPGRIRAFRTNKGYVHNAIFRPLAGRREVSTVVLVRWVTKLGPVFRQRSRAMILPRIRKRWEKPARPRG